MVNNGKGKQILTAFQYVQQVFRECGRIFIKLDNLMAPDWKSVYGNRITKEVTSHLSYPERWLVESIFRVYVSDVENVNKGIAITFWSDVDAVEEPTITVGKITYKDFKARDHWDIWSSWFVWNTAEDDQLISDGRIIEYSPKDINHVSNVKVFSLPLISIETDYDIEIKIHKPLRNL